MNYDMKQSGERIQQLRIQHGYTQGELARELNVDRSYLSRIESGKTDVQWTCSYSYPDFLIHPLITSFWVKKTTIPQCLKMGHN